MSNDPTVIVYREGTHRVSHPRETLARFAPRAAEFGITRLADVTDLDVVGVPVVQAIRPNGRCLSVSQGKGLTYDAAAASALMEAIELWHAEHHRLPQVRASSIEMRIDARIIDQSAITLLDPHHPTYWVLGNDLASSDEIWVPEALVGMDTTQPRWLRCDALGGSTSGLASGNNLTEATAHALFELIERDAAAALQGLGFEALTERRLRLGSVDCREGIWLIERCRSAGLQLAVFEITSGLGLPAFDCLVFDDRPDSFRALGIARGMGCHAARDVAFCRAVTEALQSRLTVIAASRDDLASDRYRHARFATVGVEAQRFLRVQAGRREWSEVPTFEVDTIHDELAVAKTALSRAGIDEIVAVDLTQKEFGVPVTKLVVPGLAHWGERGASRRSVGNDG